MATYGPINLSKHATLTANTVDTVNVRGNAVEVANRGSDPIYFTVDGTAPTVAGQDTYYVAGGSALQVTADYDGLANVKLISVGATAYTVTAVG